MKSLVSTSLLAVVFCLALLTGCSSPKKALVGKWAAPDGSQLEFTLDGKLLMSMGGISINGNYTVLDDSHFKSEISAMGQTKTDTIGFAVKDDTLTTTDEKGKKEDLKRVK